MNINILLSKALPSIMAVDLGKALTSATAIIVYVVLILVLILILVFIIMTNEKRRVEDEEEIVRNKTEKDAEIVVDQLTKVINKNVKSLETRILASDEKIDTILEKPNVIIAPTPTKGKKKFPTSVKNEKLQSQLDEVTTETKTEVQEGDSESRFCMLTNIDKAMETYVEPEYNNEISLKELCETFRNFACSRLRLYYDITDIRRFIAGLSVTKLLILQGMSGTGKTSLPYAFGQFLTNETVIVPIQPMWKERTDLVGYYNEFTRKFNETTLLRKMYEANCNRQLYVTVLDEMNIARIEYYFAEFLSLLEIPNPDGRNLDVVSDVWSNDPKLLKDGKLRLPINMWFVGTANNDDSTFAISDKVYDRAMVLNLDKKAEVFEAPETPTMSISVDHLYDLFAKAQKEFDLSDRNLRRIDKLDKYLIDTFHITFGNRIMKQIRAYVPVLVACGGTELEALDDILSRKVLRKLESKNPVYVRSQSEALCNFLDDLFGQDKMVLCKETIKNIEQNV